jgi:hydrogenase expression/formation protein HypC
MCLGIPGQIVEILDEEIYLAKASVGGVRRNINIGLVHHDEQRIKAEAHSALRALEQIGEEYEQELEELKASQIE